MGFRSGTWSDRVDKPSEPFEVIGKIIPRYENENWTFTELLYEAPYLKSYQDEEDEEDEEADCLEYIDNTDKIIYLLYRRWVPWHAKLDFRS